MITKANREGNYRRWDSYATRSLIELREAGLSRQRLAQHFNRSPKAIKAKLEYERARNV